MTADSNKNKTLRARMSYFKKTIWRRSGHGSSFKRRAKPENFEQAFLVGEKLW